jgi:N-acetylneuraminate synthase
MNNNIFDELFVLELANNHLGDLNRGLKIISDYGKIVRFNNIRAAIKLQFRDVDSFIHKDYRNRTDIRYIKKTLATKMSHEDYGVMVNAITRNGCIPMASPFDEASVDLCVKLDLPIIKIASADMNDWILIEKIAATKRPVIASTGGSSLKDMDDLVKFFERRNIPFAINHCVSLYPSEDNELELNQIDFLKNRYPGHIIGFSTHEYHNWEYSVMMAYAKGARTFERHVDIDKDGIPVSPYCSLPHNVDKWFKAFQKAKEMCGAQGTAKRIPPIREIKYLDETVRGIYAKYDFPKGHKISESDLFLAIPLLKGQISCKELMSGEVLLKSIKKDRPIFIDDIDSPYAYDEELKGYIYERGISPEPPVAKEETVKKTLKANRKETKHKKRSVKR